MAGSGARVPRGWGLRAGLAAGAGALVAVGAWAVFATGLGVSGQAGSGLQAGSGAAESVPTCQDTPVAVQAVYSDGVDASGAYTVDLDGFDVTGISADCAGMNLQLAVRLTGQDFWQLPDSFVVNAEQSTYTVPATGLPAHQPEQIQAYSLRLVPNPNAVTDLTLNAGDGQIEVSFTAPAAGTSTISAYEYSLDDGSTWIRRASTATTFTITGLTNGTTYPIRVRAINTTGPSPASATATATPRINAPTALTATAGNTTATITFTAPETTSTITNYAYTLDNGTTWTPLDPADPASPIHISALTNNTTYTIVLRALDTNGHGLNSEPVTVTPEATDENLAPALILGGGATGL